MLSYHLYELFNYLPNKFLVCKVNRISCATLQLIKKEFLKLHILNYLKTSPNKYCVRERDPVTT